MSPSALLLQVSSYICQSFRKKHDKSLESGQGSDTFRNRLLIRTEYFTPFDVVRVSDGVLALTMDAITIININNSNSNSNSNDVQGGRGGSRSYDSSGPKEDEAVEDPFYRAHRSLEGVAVEVGRGYIEKKTIAETMMENRRWQ